MNKFKPKYLSVSPESGQLAVGIAFAFAGILAMFGLVFQSSLNTVDKAKLQTTADYAVLQAANNQVANLNEIKKINEAIQIAWDATQLELQPSYAQINAVAGTSLTVTWGNAILNAGTATLGHVTTGTCESLGEDVDKWYRKKIIEQYTTGRNQAASAIATIVTDSNELSYDIALNHFLDPEGLPHGMFMQLKKTLGETFNVNDVRKAYENGSLANNEEYTYEILDANKDDPLFIPKNEPRLFSYTKYLYQTITDPLTYNVYCVGPFFGSVKTSIANARVVRATDDTAYFFAGIRYIPALSIIQKTFGLGVKNPDSASDDFGKDIDDGIDKEKLFREREKAKRTMMQVMAAAKPYGGSYPEAGFVADSSGISGQTGDSFKSAKLFGIADTEEIEGHRIHRADGSIANRDNQGNVIGELPFYAEDFLH
jgi:hypothetical protein